MGASISSNGSGSRIPTALAEINVTPLVDVMLVLLIVFMISAPLMQQGIQVDLPKANAGTLNETPEQLTIIVDKNQTIRIADKDIPRGSFRNRIDAIAAAKPNIEVVIQGDSKVDYGFVARVMADVKASGIHRVGLSTQAPTDNQAL